MIPRSNSIGFPPIPDSWSCCPVDSRMKHLGAASKLSKTAVQAQHKEQEKKKKKDVSVVTEDLLKQPAKECLSCEQNTHNYDRDKFPAEEHLHWRSVNFSKRLNMHRASGDECYVCYDTRRRFFDNT